MLNSLNWMQSINVLNQQSEAWVLATVLGTRGSAPRDSGSKMVITSNTIYDTIGGGRLEYKVIERAHAMLEQHSGKARKNSAFTAQQLLNFPLAATTNQCCGGQVSVLLELFENTKQPLHIFGAGHIAHALVPILKEMDFQIHWVDTRESLFPEEQPIDSLKYCVYDNVLDHIRSISPNSLALILTHDHHLDYELTCALLDRGDCAFIGLIGSETKAMRFKKRLRSDSFSDEEISSIHCPVGITGVTSKKPVEIAISIAAQLVQITQLHSANKKRSGMSWKELTEALEEKALRITENNLEL